MFGDHKTDVQKRYLFIHTIGCFDMWNIPTAPPKKLVSLQVKSAWLEDERNKSANESANVY